MDRTPDPFKRVSWTVLRAELGVPLIHRTRHPRLPPPKPRGLEAQRVRIAFHEDAWFTFEYTPIRPPMGVVRLPSRWD